MTFFLQITLVSTSLPNFQMLDEHICPQLEKLKADKQDYANYTRMKREHEQLSKLYTAWDFARTEVKSLSIG